MMTDEMRTPADADRTADTALTALRERFDVVDQRLTIGGREVLVRHPRSAEALIDEAAFEHDERLPYWADVWPSSLVLAERVAAMPGTGQTALELGCGIGIVGIAAARAGFQVIATDYYPEALEFARVNVAVNAGVVPRTRMVDWRALPDDLERADVVLASDVLYERPYASLVAEAIDRTLSDGATAYVADPGRVAMPAFLDAVKALRLIVTDVRRTTFQEGQIRQTISVYEIHRG